MTRIQTIKWELLRRLRDYKWFRKLMDKKIKNNACSQKNRSYSIGSDEGSKTLTLQEER